MSRRSKAAAIVATVVAILALSSLAEAPGCEQTDASPPGITEAAEAFPALGESVLSAPEQERAPEPTAPPSRYGGIQITDDDVETLARLVWLEARGEPFEGQVAVVEVVLNRILSPSFPDTVAEVVYQRDPVQFSPAARIPSTTPTETQYEAVTAAIEGTEPITDADVVYFSTGAQNDRVYKIIGNHVFCRE